MKNNRTKTLVVVFITILFLAIPLASAHNKINIIEDDISSFSIICTKGKVTVFIGHEGNESLNYSLLVRFKRWIRPAPYNETKINDKLIENNSTSIEIPVSYNHGPMTLIFSTNKTIIVCLGYVILNRPIIIYQGFSWNN